MEVDVDLAILAALGNGNAGSDGGDVGVKDQSESVTVSGQTDTDGALWASGTTVADGLDVDLGGVKSRWEGNCGEWCSHDWGCGITDGIDWGSESTAKEGNSRKSEELHIDG